MARALVRRLLWAIALLLASATLTFMLGALAPGDPLADLRIDPRVSPEALQRVREVHHLDDPLPVRYGRWLTDVFHGDLGESVTHGVPVTSLLAQRVPNTLLLSLTALALAWIAALPLGAWAGHRPDGVLARALGVLTTTFTIVPDVALALGALALAAGTGWFPAGGMTSASDTSRSALDVARHLALPASVLAASLLPAVARHAEAGVRDALASPLATSLAARGLSRRRIVFAHALRVASAPLVALLALSAGTTLGTAVVVETVFGWPGLGPLLLDAVFARDTPVVVGAVLTSATLLVLATTAGDIVSARLDPRGEHQTR